MPHVHLAEVKIDLLCDYGGTNTERYLVRSRFNIGYSMACSANCPASRK